MVYSVSSLTQQDFANTAASNIAAFVFNSAADISECAKCLKATHWYVDNLIKALADVKKKDMDLQNFESNLKKSLPFVSAALDEANKKTPDIETVKKNLDEAFVHMRNARTYNDNFYNPTFENAYFNYDKARKAVGLK